MRSRLDILGSFKSANNFEGLWQEFRSSLSDYEVSSAIYCVSNSALSIKEDGVETSCWYKNDHPEAYRKYFDKEFTIQDDPTALHCLVSTSPYIWDNPSKNPSLSSSQHRFMQESQEFGMKTGVTLPIRFGQTGVGGFGLNTDPLSFPKFTKMWSEHYRDITSIASWFDEFARSKESKVMYTLSNRETEVLTWLAIGKKTEQVADKLGIAASTTEKYIRRAREKLDATNNEQAIAKAIAFERISP